MYPPFNFAKIFSDVAFKAGSTINVGQGLIIKGEGFFWKDLFETRVLRLGDLGRFVVPPPYQALLFLCLDCAIWGLLSWYFNNILGEGALPWYFPFTKTYWGIDKCTRQRKLHDASHGIVDDAGFLHEHGGGGNVSSVGASAAVEDADECSAQRNLVEIANLVKVFGGTGPSCCASAVNVAVNDVSFEIRRGEIFGLLGHNGAGKSTIINMLTGLVTPTSGSMTVAGLPVDTMLAEVRQMLGVCPQHDILWEELTALDHLLLFAQLKGMSFLEAQDEARERLLMVGLWDVANDKVSTFSGGMKRRLSVAISAIGDPAFMLLDEPSTGMDPVNQKQMWKLVQKLKKDRCILLTTHSMREAEVLADRISIIAFGKICAAGTTVALKHYEGLHYLVHVATQDTAENVDALKSLVNSVIPGAPVTEKHDGAVKFLVAPNQVSLIAPLLAKLEETRVSGSKMVEEWGITETSLEDVFLSVTRAAGFKYEAFEHHDHEIAELVKHGAHGASRKALLPKSSPLLSLSGDDQSAEGSSNHDFAASAAASSPFDGKKEPSSPSLLARGGDDSDNDDDDHDADSDVRNEKTGRRRVLSALLAKNVKIQGRQWGTNLCQILTPLIVLVIMFILKVKKEICP